MPTTTTYKYNAGTEAGTNWTNDANAWDDNIGTFAYRDIPKNTSKETTKWIKATTVSGVPSTGLPISMVEIGIEGKEESTNVSMYAVPIFGGSTDGDEHSLTGMGAANSTQWVDITSDTNAPSTWAWTDVQNLDIKVYGANNNFSAARMEYVNQFYVRVTYGLVPTIYGAARLNYCKFTLTSGTYGSETLSSDNFNDNSFDSGIWDTLDNDGVGCTTILTEQNQRLEWEHTIISGSADEEADIEIFQDSVSGDFDISVKVVDVSISGAGYNDVMVGLVANGVGAASPSWRYAIEYYSYDVGSMIDFYDYAFGWDTADAEFDGFPVWFRFTFIDGTLTMYYSYSEGSWTQVYQNASPNASYLRYIGLYSYVYANDADPAYITTYMDDVVNTTYDWETTTTGVENITLYMTNSGIDNYGLLGVDTTNSGVTSDNFNDNSFDAGIWYKIEADGGVVTEQNQRLEFTSTTTSGECYLYQPVFMDTYDIKVKIVDSNIEETNSIFYVFPTGTDNSMIVGYFLAYFGGWFGAIAADSSTFTPAGYPFWIRIMCDGDNSYCFYSDDNIKWNLIKSGATGIIEDGVIEFIWQADDTDKYIYIDDFINGGMETCYFDMSSNLSHEYGTDMRIRKDGVTYTPLTTWSGS